MAEIGWPVICQRALEAIEKLPDSTILAGFSMGAGVISAGSAQSASLLIENHNYIGTKHFFTDFNSTDYDVVASELAWKRALVFLDGL
jgi:dienelactone hydrolase